MPKHTNVIDIAIFLCQSIQMSFHDWQATVVIWLLCLSLRIFYSFPSKRVKRVLSTRDNLILLITNKNHKSHLLSYAKRCSSKLQKIQSLENFVSMAIQGTQVPMYTKHAVFVFFFLFFLFIFILKTKQNKN